MVTENGTQGDGNTAFLRAARAGNLERVMEHLKNNIDINTSNANGLNALHLASKDGHIHVVYELLRRGAIVDSATKKGNTALHIASLAGQEEVVKLLLENGASVNVQSQNGFTPLYMAAQENHDSVVKLLLASGANQSLATEDGFTPLAVAMQQGHDKVVAVLLESDTRGKVRLPALHIAAKKDDVKAATLLLDNDHNPDVTSKSGFTPLHIASHYGNQAIATLLIQKGADVNYSAKHNISPLHVAAKWGKTNMVSLLLEKGANIEAKTRDGLTPLHCAARSGHEQVVDMLLERGAPISAKTKNGLAPLHMAAQGEHVDAARILLYHRAPVDEVTVDYLTALHVAAHCGHVRVAKLLLDRNADANARALNGFTPLHIACKKNRIKVVELLLRHGASISATTESGLTPLHVAAFMGCMNIVIYLLQHDASPDVPTVRGETPLHLAARANQTDIIRILLRNGAQVDARAREQQTPLHIASRLGNVDIVMLLLQHGAQVDATTKDMYTALHIAAKEGQDEVAAVLIENGAALDAATKKGFTPLHLTAKYGHTKVAQLLLQKEADVDAQGKNGVTPLHVACHYDNQVVALLLLEKGASPHATAKNGHTPLHIAARKNQMDIASTLLEYGAQANAESKAGFTPLHLSCQEGHAEISSLLIANKAGVNHPAKNGLTPMHLCAQEDNVNVAEILEKHGANIDMATKAGYTPLHVAAHFGQANMVRFLLQHGANVDAATSIGYTPLHQTAQQGHCHIVNLLLEHKANANAQTVNGQTPLHIARKLGYISVLDSLKTITKEEDASTQTVSDEKYRVVAPEAMHESFMSDSEEEGGEDNMLSDQPYRYLTVDEMKSLGDDSLPIDVTRDERVDSNRMTQSAEYGQTLQHQATINEESLSPHKAQVYGTGKSMVDGVYISNGVHDNEQQHVGRKLSWKSFLVSFLVDARGGAMRGCRHSGVRMIIPSRSTCQPTRVTCRYVKPQRTMHPPQLMEGEALASRVLELGPVSTKFIGPVVMEVPHFASLRGKEREIIILRSDNGETWREHTIDNSEEIIHDVMQQCFEPEEIAQLEEQAGNHVCRFVTYDFPQYFAVVSRIRQEVHAIGPEGGMVSSTVVPQVQAVFPQGALTKKIKVGLQAQPVDPDLTAKLLGRGVAVSPIVTVEPRRRKFHKAITLSMPAPKAHSQGMINQYSGNTPTLRLLCSITGGPSRAQWEDVTGSTPLTFVNDCVSFTTTVSARFWLMDCRNISEATKMATELYKEVIHVPFIAKFVVFAKKIEPYEARLRVFCMTDDREDKTLEKQELFTEVAKSRDVEVLEGKPQFIEMAGNLVPVTKSGEQLQLQFKAFRENRLPFTVRVKDQHADIVGRTLFMREPKVAKGEPPQHPICILNIVLPEAVIPDSTTAYSDKFTTAYYRNSLSKHQNDHYIGDIRIVDLSNLLGKDWIQLAPEIGITAEEIDEIIDLNTDSIARQAQSMIRLYKDKPQYDLQALETALKTIGRDDIMKKCKSGRLTHSRDFDETDIMKNSESVEELVRKESKRIQQLHEREEVKYSAEEKEIEESESDEELTKRSVAERREKIVKRLSMERQIPASTQKREITREITEIKRKSLIEDKKAIHESEILMQLPTDNVIKSTVAPEQVYKMKMSKMDSGEISKQEFDKELTTKLKTSGRSSEEEDSLTETKTSTTTATTTTTSQTTTSTVRGGIEEHLDNQKIIQDISSAEKSSKRDSSYTASVHDAKVLTEDFLNVEKRSQLPAEETISEKFETEITETKVESSSKKVENIIHAFENGKVEEQSKTKVEETKESSKIEETIAEFEAKKVTYEFAGTEPKSQIPVLIKQKHVLDDTLEAAIKVAAGTAVPAVATVTPAAAPRSSYASSSDSKSSSIEKPAEGVLKSATTTISSTTTTTAKDISKDFLAMERQSSITKTDAKPIIDDLVKTTTEIMTHVPASDAEQKHEKVTITTRADLHHTQEHAAATHEHAAEELVKLTSDIMTHVPAGVESEKSALEKLAKAEIEKIASHSFDEEVVTKTTTTTTSTLEQLAREEMEKAHVTEKTIGEDLVKATTEIITHVPPFDSQASLKKPLTDTTAKPFDDGIETAAPTGKEKLSPFAAKKLTEDFLKMEQKTQSPIISAMTTTTTTTATIETKDLAADIISQMGTLPMHEKESKSSTTTITTTTRTSTKQEFDPIRMTGDFLAMEQTTQLPGTSITQTTTTTTTSSTIKPDELSAPIKVEPRKSLTDAEFCKSVQDSITKKMSEGLIEISDELKMKESDIPDSQTPPPTPIDIKHEKQSSSSSNTSSLERDDIGDTVKTLHKTTESTFERVTAISSIETLQHQRPHLETSTAPPQETLQHQRPHLETSTAPPQEADDDNDDADYAKSTDTTPIPQQLTTSATTTMTTSQTSQHDMPTPKPRSLMATSAELDADELAAGDAAIITADDAEVDSFMAMKVATAASQVTATLTGGATIVETSAPAELLIDVAGVPVPKPRSQIKHNDSYKNLAALGEQSDSISLRSLDITDELSRTEEPSTEMSIKSQLRDMPPTTNNTTTTTTTTTTASEDQTDPTESYEPTSEISVDETETETQRSGSELGDNLNTTTSFYIGESSRNIITKTTVSKSGSGLETEDELAGVAKDEQSAQEGSDGSDELNDVFKEYVTLKRSEDDEKAAALKLRRQSSETRNDLLEESPAAEQQQQKVNEQTFSSSSTGGGMDMDESIKELSELSDLESMKATANVVMPLSMMAGDVAEKMQLPLEKSEWEISEKDIPKSQPKVVHSPQQPLQPQQQQLTEKSEFTDDISSFIGIPGELNVAQKSEMFTETLSKEATSTTSQYSHGIFGGAGLQRDGREEPSSLGFVSTGTAEDLSSSSEHAAKEEHASLGFVSTETADDFSSMEDYYQEKLAGKPSGGSTSVDSDKAASSSETFGEISTEQTMKPFDVVVHRVKTSDPASDTSNRWSVPEIDNSSSSESYYKSYEKSHSRPLSSDVDNMMTANTSSEYQTARDGSSIYRETTEYVSAVSAMESSSAKTISSHESMKSLDSQSEMSANLGSIDVSELSETLVASSTEADALEAEELARLRDLHKDDEDSEDSLEAQVQAFDIMDQKMHQSMMKRSQEMIFKPKETKPEQSEVMETMQIEEFPKAKEAERTWGLAYPMDESRLEDTERPDDILLYHSDVRRSIDDSKLASSLDDGSILSVSMSSTSNVETVVENFEEMIGSAGSSSLTGMEGYGFAHDEHPSSLPEDTFVMEMDNRDQSPTDSQSNTPPGETRRRGHKRSESTVPADALKALAEAEGEAGPGGAGGGGGETKESESESDTDPYESEYSRQFRSPSDRKGKKKKAAAAEMDHGFEPEKRPFTPSQLVAEVIVEDSLTEELEAEELMEERRPSQNMQDYSNIPDIMVTEDTSKSPELDEETDEFQEQNLYKVKTQEELHKASDAPLYQTQSQTATSQMAAAKEESFQKMVQEQYHQKLAELQRAHVGDSDDDENKAPDSPDSFEMVEQPDISDEFVIIEEVAKEANEVDLGGKSIKIKPTKYESKHDEEVEKIIIKSAPADPKLGSQIYRDDLNFEFEESPPTAGSSSGDQQDESETSEAGAANKRWVEMQLTDAQLRYPYDITGGVLEDIKEEDGEFEVGSSRISSFKDSYSSTPEYARRYYARGEHDDISLSSLQEFESLEQAISLENRNKTHQGSTDSSNGSFTKRYMVRHSGSGTAQGDDISVSSLKEFEGLENACFEAHLIEIKAKEEAALLSRSDESNKSNGSDRGSSHGSAGSNGGGSGVVVTKVTRTVTRTEVPVAQQQQNIEALLKQKLEECESKEQQLARQAVEGVTEMVVELKTTKIESQESEKDSIDSMEISKSHDVMTSSIDSFDISKDATTRSDIDSLEVDRKQPTREESIDSIENEQMDFMSKFVSGGATLGDGLTTTTTTTTTSTDADGHEHTVVTRIVTTTTTSSDGGGISLMDSGVMTKDISADSLNLCIEQTTSSAGTTATYQTSAGNSQMSGSVTSCASSTLMEDSYPTPAMTGSSSYWSHEEATQIEAPEEMTMEVANRAAAAAAQQTQQPPQQER